MSALLGVLVAGFIAASPALAQSRGELLYSTHCISCHNQQMHWRDQRAATDWSSLQVQVRRWQSAASLGWAEADILEVARYLNATIYRFEQTPEPRISQGPVTKPSVGKRAPDAAGRQSGVGGRSAAS
jgi:mono/diheme cytochrome c family protein